MRADISFRVCEMPSFERRTIVFCTAGKENILPMKLFNVFLSLKIFIVHLFSDLLDISPISLGHTSKRKI